MTDINIGQLVTTTLRNRRGELSDNMSDNVPFYNRLRQRGKMSLDGGRDIVIPLEYAENGSFMFYSGYETLNISVNDFIDAAVFDWKQASVAVSISGLEQIKNSGRHALFKLLKSKIRNAERTYTNIMGAQVHADGTGTSGKEIGGLGLINPETNTNTVGGVPANTYSWWRNQVMDFTTVNGGATTASNIQAAMQLLYASTMRNAERADLILMDDAYYTKYWASLVAIQQITESKVGNAGFASLKFVGADVFNEGGVGGPMSNTSITTADMHMLNSTYLDFMTHSDRDIEIVGGERRSLNQDATVQLMLWAGNMGVSNRQLQGRGKE